MTKILHLCPYYYPSIGGVETFCQEIALRTARLDHDVEIITQKVEGLKDYEEVDGVKIHRIRPLFGVYKAKVMPNIHKKIQEIQPDVIHIQGPTPGMMEFALRSSNARIIMTAHNDLSGNESTIYKTISAAYRLLIFSKIRSKLDKLILPSESYKYNSKLFKGFPPEKISIIPNGVDLEKFSPGKKSKDECKRGLGINSKFLVLFVGSMEPLHAYKGVEYLLDAIRNVKGVDTMYCLVGEGDLKKRYIEKAKEIGITDKVRFAGKVDTDTLVQYYRAADVFVLPSVSTEVMPIVMLEAMACGTPVITTRIHGPMEMIQEGYIGYLVEPKDSVGLARTIVSTLLNESTLAQMQKNARKEAEDKYSWDIILKKYLEEYGII